MNDTTPARSPVLVDIEAGAKDYADRQSELLSLQLQRAYVEGALKGYQLAVTQIALNRERPAAANDSGDRQ